MSSSGDLTILLTLKDRTEFTVRWMNYANSIGLPFKVLIADGGFDETISAILSDKKRFPDVNYEYVRYPYDKTYADYYSKIANALGRVQTPFVAMADNDDFFIVDTLTEAVEFLSVNPDYASCGGQPAQLWIRPSPLNKPEDLVYSKNVNWKCARIRSITAGTARERLRSQAVSSADPIYYDVKRIEDVRKQSEIVRDLNLNDLFLTEFLTQFLTTITGKTKRLEKLYIARQHNAPGSSAEAHQKQFGDWFGLMLVESWSEDFTKFVNCVSSILAATDGISIPEAKDCVVTSYRMNVAPELLSNILEEPSVTMSMPVVVRAVRRLVMLPEENIFRKLARKLYRTIPWIALDSVYGIKIVAMLPRSSRKELKPILEFLARPR